MTIFTLVCENPVPLAKSMTSSLTPLSKLRESDIQERTSTSKTLA